MINAPELVAFTTKLQGLKYIVRWKGQFFWRDYPDPTAPERYESVADHSWRLAMLVLGIKDQLAQPLNLEKALTFALIHDIPEIIAGDASPLGEDGTGKHTYDQDPTLAAERHTREQAAANQIFRLMPPDQADWLYKAWEECEARVCFEAQLIKALDKIEALLQVLEYRQGNMFPEHLTFTLNRWRKYQDVDPAVKALGEEICRQMQERFKEFSLK